MNGNIIFESKQIHFFIIKFCIQVMSRYKQLNLERREEESPMHNLIKELLKVWSAKKVEEKYQNYFLLYLDTLPKKEAEGEIAREIKLTLENKSHYFRIARARVNRSTIMEKVRQSIEEVRDVQDEALVDFQHFANLLNQLRNSNLRVAQEVLNFNYECLANGQHDFQLIQGNNYLFEELNTENLIIKTSFLEQYINFSNSYDPFFLHHYQNNKKMEIYKKQNESIRQLFSLSISKAYRFMKAQQQILQFLSGRIPTKLLHGKMKRPHYQLIDDKKLKEDMKTNVFRLENHIYMNQKESERNHYEEDSLQRSKTEESPMQNYAIFKKPKHEGSFTQNFYKYRLPRLENIRRTTQVDSQFPQHERLTSIRKYSEQEAANKYTFKIRRMSMKGNRQPPSPTLSSKDGARYLSNISKVKERETQFLKYSQKEKLNIKHEESQIRASKVVVDQALDNERQDPLVYKQSYQSPTLKVRPITMQKHEETPPQAKPFKNFKLKAGNLKVSNIFIFLKELKIKESYRSTFEVGNWEHSISNNQYYFHKYYIDEGLQAVSLCCALPEGDILIKYWAPLETCDQEMSHFLFKKYLQHIEKNSISKSIFYNAPQITQVINNGFIKQKQRIYVRQRTIPQQIDSYNYFPFLTLNFSIIAVPKTTSKQILEDITIKSNKMVPFNDKEFICFNYLLITNKIINSLSSGLTSFGTYTPNIKNFKEVSTKLIKEQMFQSPYNTHLDVSPVNLMTLKLKNPLFSAFFVANHPYVKVLGEEIYSDEESLIVSLQFLKNNTRLYFGKGFSSISSMITVMKNRSSKKKRIEYCLRMFSKRMRGRILSINLRDQYCFGDFEIIFEWIDFLRGKIEHNLKKYELFGDQNYYCIVEIEKENILGFEVKADNFI